MKRMALTKGAQGQASTSPTTVSASCSNSSSAERGHDNQQIDQSVEGCGSSSCWSYILVTGRSTTLPSSSLECKPWIVFYVQRFFIATSIDQQGLEIKTYKSASCLSQQTNCGARTSMHATASVSIDELIASSFAPDALRAFKTKSKLMVRFCIIYGFYASSFLYNMSNAGKLHTKPCYHLKIIFF